MLLNNGEESDIDTRAIPIFFLFLKVYKQNWLINLINLCSTEHLEDGQLKCVKSELNYKHST